MTTITGTNLDDVLATTAAGDVVYGLAGLDEITIGHDDAEVWAGQGDDIVQSNGATGATLYLGAGDDFAEVFGGSVAFGGAGDDTMTAAGDGAILRGDDGDDYLEAQAGGADAYIKLNGGADADTFFFAGGVTAETLIHVRDFDAAEGDAFQIGGLYDGATNVGPSTFGDIVWTDRTDGGTGQDFVTAEWGDLTLRIDDHHAADLCAADFAFI
ncbi:MAG: hypothetical protein AAF192_01200 [Pseudomonadota bacterium]